MTERKPEGLSWQSWVDRQIREGQQGGAFDDLDGRGRPIDDIGVVHDELWWLKAKLRDEDIEYLPPTIAIRAERAAAIDAAMDSSTEATARVIIEDVNARIRYINSHGAGGPPSTAVAIDVETLLDRWQAAHPPMPVVDDRVDTRDHHDDHAAGSTRRWWHRVVLWWRSSARSG
jgi:hypothetical protein